MRLGGAENPGWAEGLERDRGWLAEQQLRHDLGGAGREQDTVAIVARGDEEALCAGNRTEVGEEVRRGRTQAGPALDDACAGQLGKEDRGAGKELGEVVGMDDAVEAGFLNGGADNGLSGAWAVQARHQVKLPGAEDQAGGERGRRGHREHLAFAREDAECGAECGGERPGAGAVDELRGSGFALSGAEVNGGGGLRDGKDGLAGVKRDGGRAADGCDESGGELTRIEACLFERDKGVIVRLEGGAECVKFLVGECMRRVSRGKRLQGAGCLKARGHLAGERGEFLEQREVERAAVTREFKKSRGVVGVFGGEHAGGGRGRFLHGLGGGEHGDLCAEACKRESEGETDDAGAGDRDVRTRHVSLDDCGRATVQRRLR